jgi:hypothetical protein
VNPERLTALRNHHDGWSSPAKCDGCFLGAALDEATERADFEHDSLVLTSDALQDQEDKTDAALAQARTLAETLKPVIDAARTLHHFLWEEKQTTAPPDELRSVYCFACESSADYEREEQLTEALGAALDEYAKGTTT